MTRSVLSQAHSKNIDQSVGGVSYVGNSPLLLSKASGTLGTGADIALGVAPLASVLRGIVVKVTTTVAGGDSTLTAKVGGTTVATLVVPEGTVAGETLHFDLGSDMVVAEMGTALVVSNDAVPSAGVVLVTAVAEPI